MGSQRNVLASTILSGDKHSCLNFRIVKDEGKKFSYVETWRLSSRMGWVWSDVDSWRFLASGRRKLRPISSRERRVNCVSSKTSLSKLSLCCVVILSDADESMSSTLSSSQWQISPFVTIWVVVVGSGTSWSLSLLWKEKKWTSIFDTMSRLKKNG